MDKKELAKYLAILEERKKNYWIMSTKLQEHQLQIYPALKERHPVKKSNPLWKFILYQWWNGSWKTMLWMYITANYAMWDYSSKYWIEYLWNKKDIRVVTKSWSNVQSVILPYLIWDYSLTRIPPDIIEKIDNDKNTIKLKNWCKISIKTYDQGRERIQGWNPDLIIIDEEPVKEEIWNEIIARSRNDKCQVILCMTPLSWLTPVYKFFYEQESEEIKSKSKVFLVSSLENKYADNTALLWLPENERKMRIYWQFVPPSWLVYPNFIRWKNTVKYFSPKELWYETKFYWAIDFWVVHPTAFLLLSVDIDWRIYVFDMIYKSWLLLKDLAREIKLKTAEYDIEYIVADTAAKRERTELREYWIKTVPADKWSKWENWESNRRSWIMKVNQLLYEDKLFIADHLKELIEEFEQHHYKDWWTKDGEVEKTKDDALDALRYFIFSYKPPKYISNMEIKYINKYWVKPQHYNKILNTNNPY